MTEQFFDLTPEQAVETLNVNVRAMRGAGNPEELGDMDPDTAFILGYETAIFDYLRYTSPDPLSVELVSLTPKENDDDTTTD
jgi:hypothetical protein